MIRGKYLRERKAIRCKRRVKLLIVMIILLILYKIIFGSYSIYESKAKSEPTIDVAFYAVEASHTVKDIPLADLNPGDEVSVTFTVANFETTKDQWGNDKKITSETDLEYDLIIRTTTNLKLEYELYKNQSDSSTNPVSILQEAENIKQEETDGIIMKYLLKKDASDYEKTNYVTDYESFKYDVPKINEYTLKIKFPEEYSDVKYQNIMDCIEITVDSRQIID
jgi:hypothetical protein